MSIHYCKFGCGQGGKYQFKNGSWCCSESYNSCPSIRKLRSEKMKGTRCGKDNPMYGGGFHSNEGKKRLRENMLGENNPCYKKKYSKEERDIMRICVKKAWDDNKELRIKAKKRGLNNFKNEHYLKKFINGSKIKPNKHEKILIKLLKNLNLNFEYVGNYKKWIGGKNPDFINEKYKKIIEYFGNYWHKKDDEVIRINHFKKYGYKTLIIWEAELKKPILLKYKIYQFFITI